MVDPWYNLNFTTLFVTLQQYGCVAGRRECDSGFILPSRGHILALQFLGHLGDGCFLHSCRGFLVGEVAAQVVSLRIPIHSAVFLILYSHFYLRLL